MHVIRDRRARPPVFELAVDTGETSLPCAAIGPVVDGLAELGDECRFRGGLRARQGKDGWAGELAGWLDEVDLKGAVADRFGHVLEGTARVVVQDARFEAGQLREAIGSVAAGPGVVGRPLAERATRWLRFAPGKGLSTTEEVLPFQRMAMAFSVDAIGLRVRGECEGEEEKGVAVTGRRGPLLTVPPGHIVPTAAVAAVLALPSDFQLPATLRTAWLTGLLPTSEDGADDPKETEP